MKENFEKISLLTIFVYMVIKSCFEFQKIAWGTGIWWGEYSLKWGIIFAVYILFCTFIVILVRFVLWRRHKMQYPIKKMLEFRERLGIFRWLFAVFIFILPIWFLQYTLWGLVFHDIYIRFIIWVTTVCLLTMIFSRRDQLAGWNEFLASLILTASAFSIAASLKYVNNYPFSLGWSEGNRLWDYSVLFGSDLYIYPADRKIPVLLDFGRQPCWRFAVYISWYYDHSCPLVGWAYPDHSISLAWLCLVSHCRQR